MRVIPNENQQPNEQVVKGSAEPTMRETEAIIDKDRRECTLSQVMVEMLVKQIRVELANHNIYMTFAAYFNLQDLPLLEEYYIGRAEEEYLHHRWIYGYLNANDAKFQYPEVKAININITDRVMPFNATVDIEIETTMGINKIVEQAMKEGDWATFNWLQGESSKTGRLVLEQVEEESISRTIAGMAKEDAGWLSKQATISGFYKSGRD